MSADVVVLRADDDRRAPLERAGWVVSARSWGAQLDGARADRAELRRRLDAVADSVLVRELTGADVDLVLALDAATADDYPGDVATRHEPLTPERAVPTPSRRAFGAFDGDGSLVAMTWIDTHDERAETDFTVVAAPHRRNGYGSAVKAASLLALLDAGVRRFRTGGSSENAASIAASRAVGYAIDEAWVTLRPGRPPSDQASTG